MGYTTEFWGQIEIEPALNKKEIAYLQKFSDTRRMAREKGEYYVDGGGHAGQDHEDDITEYNSPPPEQPSLWCGWTVTDDGNHIEWNGAEKFHNAAQWMWYIINNFIKPEPFARIKFPDQFAFLKGHICNGEIGAQGEDNEDKWNLGVKDNEVFVETGHIVYDKPMLIKNEALEIKYCYEANKQSKKCNSCKTRFKCYTGSPEPKPKYGGWGESSFWEA